MKYVLVSGSFHVVDTPHQGEVLGQEFEMTDDLAKSAILSGASLLPKDMFDAQGFNANELASFPNARLQAAAPDTFKRKFEGAVKAVADYRAKLAAPPAAEPIPAPGKAGKSEVKA